MNLLDLPGWRVEYDHEATVAAHSGAPANGPESCVCAPCRNWAATRESLLPREFRELLDRLGIPFDREREVYHNCRLETGLHSYGGWYHFVGRVLSGERECSPTASSISKDTIRATDGVHSRRYKPSGSTPVSLEMLDAVMWCSGHSRCTFIRRPLCCRSHLTGSRW